jgi:hypothetical protein
MNDLPDALREPPGGVRREARRKNLKEGKGECE